MLRLALLAMLLASCSAFGRGFTPEAALKRMQLPEGFQARVVACEPMIRQPLSISFDAKGRLWVLQYLQYPNPAGLKPIKQDQYLRTIWDKVPEPPPHGPKGLDRITICFDPDEHGRYRQSKDFVTGLNLATGFCIGHGGVFVVQPPYLLFYPDKNGDDIPDGDPEVLLTGFGMEDTHSYANSLQWGPDGWLYGAHGSTVTAKIVNPARPKEPAIEFQQGIWRYHPRTREFELFAEGGGNTYGLDFDKFGRCIAGTNWGGKAMLHHVQGGYYIKGFSKHGPLHNPHTYGYFDHVPYDGFKGGHVTCGGVVYQANTYPKEFHDQYIAGNLLSNAVYWHKMTPQGSTFTAKHGGDLLVAQDSWFRPVDCFLGPDGSVYVADWYDKRAAHLDPIDNWDKTNGRVYRIEYRGTKQPAAFDLTQQSSRELLEILKHPNKWWRNEARRLLAERRDPSVIEPLKQRILDEKELFALEALWALEVTCGLDEAFALKCLEHPNEHVRSWTVRLVGDRRKISARLAERLMHVASKDPSATVRSQLACTAKRLPAQQCLTVVTSLLQRNEDRSDAHIPMLLWWAIEAKAISDRESLLSTLLDSKRIASGFWRQPIVRDFILERLSRRYLAEGTPEALNAAKQLLDKVPGTAELALMIRGMSTALEGRKLEHPTEELLKSLRARCGEEPTDPEATRLALRLGDHRTYQRVLARLQAPMGTDAERIRDLSMLAEQVQEEALPVVTRWFNEGKHEAVRLAAFSALQRFPGTQASEVVLNAFPKLTGNLRQRAQSFLLSRAETAKEFLKLLDKGQLRLTDVPIDQLRPVIDFKDPELTRVVEKHWGKIAPATPGEKQARISWLNITLGKAQGDVSRGKLLFTKLCASCHTLHGEGAKIGPDLTTADRKNRAYMLTQIVDPSGYIRPEFMQYIVTLENGQRLQGLVTENAGESLTLVNVIDNKAVTTNIRRKDIEEMKPSAVSIMPEKILDTLSDEEVRDLFSFLQADAPPKSFSSKEGVKKLKVVLISGSLEYKSDQTLAAYQQYLESNFPIECVRAFRKTDDDLPGLEALESCDLAIFYTRRLTIQGEQLNRVKKYLNSGKPVIGIRTASHGFQNWLEMDKEVLGGNYKGHFGANIACKVEITDAGLKHPVMEGVKGFTSNGSLYKNPEINKDCIILMRGSIPNHSEPVTWVRMHKGGRVFYTSLGHPDDFKDPNFIRMLTNAVFWTTGQDLPKK